MDNNVAEVMALAWGCIIGIASGCRVGIFSVSHVPSAVNRADVMTKPLVGGKLRVAMMLASVTSGPELLVGFEGAVARAPFWAHVARATWVFRE